MRKRNMKVDISVLYSPGCSWSKRVATAYGFLLAEAEQEIKQNMEVKECEGEDEREHRHPATSDSNSNTTKEE